jgi:DNA-directed RNA polymerase subunit RPC12/RpoP
MLVTALLSSIIFLIAALPLKNWLEIKQAEKQDKRWSKWLLEKPSREAYCLSTNQEIDHIKCDYCGSNRQLSNLEAVLIYKPKFGFLSNTYEKRSFFRSYICSGCGTQIFRERHER